MGQVSIGRMKRRIHDEDKRNGSCFLDGGTDRGTLYQEPSGEGIRRKTAEAREVDMITRRRERKRDAFSFALQIAFPASQAQLLPVTYPLT